MSDSIPRSRRDRAVVLPALRACVLLGVAPLAAGCGGEPSEKDIRAAMEQQASAAQQQMGGAFGGALAVEYHDVQKLGCEPTAQDGAYVCDVVVDVTVPIAGRQKQNGRVRLVAGDDGWVAMNP